MTCDSSLTPEEQTLLARYYTGQCTPAEVLQVDALLAGHPQAAQLTAALRCTVNELSGHWPDDETTRSFETLRLKMASHHVRRSTTSGYAASWSRRRDRASRVATGAAAMAIIGAMTLGLFIARRHDTNSDTNSGTHVRHLFTRAGETSRSTLGDGTVMTLAPATRAAVDGNTVTINGEAYFTVAPHIAHPFVVQVGNTTIQVLGTAFGVRHYTNDVNTRVVVQEGKVTLHVHRDGILRDMPTVMTAQTLALVTDSGVTVQRGVSLEEYLSWTQGRLVFQNTPVQEVVQAVSRAYGVEIRLADPTLRRQPLTLTVMVRDLPLTDLLSSLAATIGAHYTRVGNAFVLVAGRSPLPAPRAPLIPQIPHPEQSYGR